MVLPDWTAAITSQLTAWAGWSSLQLLVSVIVGASVVLVIARMLVRMFVH